MEYTIYFKEVINRSVIVEADSIEEAEEMVMENDNGNIIEDSDALDEEIVID